MEQKEIDLSKVVDATHVRLIIALGDFYHKEIFDTEIKNLTEKKDVPSITFSEEYRKKVLTNGNSDEWRNYITAERYDITGPQSTIIKVFMPKHVLSVDFGTKNGDEFISCLEEPILFYKENEQGEILYEHSYSFPSVLRYEQNKSPTFDKETRTEIRIHEFTEESHKDQVVHVAADLRYNSIADKVFVDSTDGTLSAEVVNGNMITPDFSIFFMGNLIQDGESVINPTKSTPHSIASAYARTDLQIGQSVITEYTNIKAYSTDVPDSESNIYAAIGGGITHHYYTSTGTLENT
ncbi:MAG: hypothetical protein MJZ34_02950 [Paludibacteraceae bacterium]|nr:hypothetical protein [Paludibacteraceae bacterium]